MYTYIYIYIYICSRVRAWVCAYVTKFTSCPLMMMADRIFPPVFFFSIFYFYWYLSKRIFKTSVLFDYFLIPYFWGNYFTRPFPNSRTGFEGTAACCPLFCSCGLHISDCDKSVYCTLTGSFDSSRMDFFTIYSKILKFCIFQKWHFIWTL